MKRTSLMVRLVVLYLLVSLSLFILLNTVGVRAMQRSLMEGRKSELYEDANRILTDYLMEYYQSGSGLLEFVDRLEIAGAVTELRIWMVSTAGNVILDSERHAVGVRVAEDKDAFLEQTFIENLTVPNATTEPMLAVNVPIIYKYAVRGYLLVLTPMSGIEADSIYYVDFVNICYLLFLPVLFLAFARIYALTAYPVSKITEAVKQFSRDNFKKPLKLDCPAEYQDLGSTIQYLGDRLKNADETQRKFVSNVSHDFRSPLTSIKGYVEAIKDGTIPPELQEKYLDVVLFETERLTKLTANLLELNGFDDAGISLHPSVFDINGMIKQIALTFEGTFKKKKLVLNLVFSQKEQLVEADVDKIQQVLYNLIDNAVKFSNQDSSIRITTEERGNKVVIAVKDFGIGIPKDSLNRIWERFYKTDLSRGKDKRGTGLGLSIVKEIITAHGENISVVSTEGVGTEFVFTLPLAE